MSDLYASVMAGDARAFETLLHMLMATDNEQRSQAETMFEEIQKTPDICASQLIRGLRAPEGAEVRSLAAVLLRRVRSAVLTRLFGELPSVLGRIHVSIYLLMKSTNRIGGFRGIREPFVLNGCFLSQGSVLTMRCIFRLLVGAHEGRALVAKIVSSG